MTNLRVRQFDVAKKKQMQATISQRDSLTGALRTKIVRAAAEQNFWLTGLLLIIVTTLLTLLTRSGIVGPIHVDEWTNLAYAEVLSTDKSLPHIDPLFGEGEIGYRPELGMRVFLVQLQAVTGVSWAALFPALPIAGAAMFSLSALALGASLRTGLFAGILAMGTPSSLRFLGPEYVVAVSLGLIFAATLVQVLLAPGISERSRLVIAPLIMGGLVLVHPPTALAFSVFAGILLAIRFQQTRHGEARSNLLPVVLVLLVPAIWFLSISGDLRSELLGEAGVEIESGQGLIGNYLSTAGYVRIFLMAGSLFFLFAGGFTAPKLGLLAGIVLSFGFVRAHELGLVGMANLYDRTWLYIDLLLVGSGGAGIYAAIENLPRRWSPMPKSVLQNIVLATLALVVITGAVIVRSGQDTYRIGDSQRLTDFTWIRYNLEDFSGLTLLDPDIAIGYPAIAGRTIFASTALPRPSSVERVELARELLDVYPDASRLEALGIAIVYRPSWDVTEGLTEVREGIFVVDAVSGPLEFGRGQMRTNK